MYLVIYMFEISKDALTFLKQKDARMRTLINSVPRPYEPTFDDPFEALIVIITGQQISEKAASAIVERLKDAYAPLTQTHFQSLDVDDLKKIGLSKTKAETILRLAHLNDLHTLKDADKETVNQTLLAIKGIGPWSVDMFHFMCRQDPNILSLGDIAIVNGLKRLYDLDDHASLTHFKSYFHPHGSTAAAYLWKLLDLDEPTLNTIKKEVK